MALIRNNGDIDQRERESERGDNNNNVKRASTSTRGLSWTRTMGELGMGMGATWGVIGKLGGRAGSPHYWGWIAFAGRSRAILAILRHQRQHQHRDRDHPSHYRSLETFGLFFDLKDTKCSLNWHCTITSVAASPVSSSIYQLSINLCQVERSPAFITYWSFKIPPSHI